MSSNNELLFTFSMCNCGAEYREIKLGVNYLVMKLTFISQLFLPK